MEMEKKVILVIDDEEMNLMRVKNILKDEYQVVAVKSGEQGLKYLDCHMPDMILLDIMMPKISGWDVMREIQKSKILSKVPVIFLTADNNPETEKKCFDYHAVDFCAKPIQKEVLLARIRRNLELEGYRKHLEDIVENQKNQIYQMKYEFIVSMANLVDNRDGSTGEHVKRTAYYVWCMGKALKERGMYPEIVTDRYVANLKMAAPMHDIGKISISDLILNKPGKLTPEEFDLMKQHTVYGEKVIRDTLGNIEDADFLEMVCDIALYHHEKYNGKGYPKGLQGEEIPLSARIMAIADVYDALKERRVYKDAFPLEEVYAIMNEDSGSHFDPEILKVFMDIRDEIEKK
ncbi:MAG: response regulator [Lachnospiraceae bacterium]|nr:response regulator [Lachnospiraceae bacterium]